MDISIVIVSWKVKEQVINCLQSIYDSIGNISFEIFLVDNNSGDGTPEIVTKNYSKVNLISNDKNYGFAYACNQAINKSSGSYILLLNPDTEIKKDTIGKMLNFMKTKMDCGIAGCKIVNPDGSIQPSVRKFPDIISHIMILFKLHNFFANSKSINNYYCKNFDYTKTQIVDQVMGAFFMIKMDMLREVGLLDNYYYIWYEEVDLCKRAKDKSWNTYYYSEAEVIHQKGSSFNQVRPIKKQYIFNRSMLYYFFKHTNIFKYFILVIIHPFSLLLAMIVQLSGYQKNRKDI